MIWGTLGNLNHPSRLPQTDRVGLHRMLLLLLLLRRHHHPHQPQLAGLEVRRGSHLHQRPPIQGIQVDQCEFR